MCPNAQAHGGLMTTPSDLALFAVELMRVYNGRSDRLLSKEMVRRMFTKVLDLHPVIMGGRPIGEGLRVFLYGERETTSFSFILAAVERLMELSPSGQAWQMSVRRGPAPETPQAPIRSQFAC